MSFTGPDSLLVYTGDSNGFSGLTPDSHQCGSRIQSLRVLAFFIKIGFQFTAGSLPLSSSCGLTFLPDIISPALTLLMCQSPNHLHPGTYRHKYISPHSTTSAAFIGKVMS